MDSNSMYYRYFIYSAEEEERRIRIHGKDASFGTVVVKGVPKRYTSMTASTANLPSDALLVTKGDIRKIKYNPPEKKVK